MIVINKHGEYIEVDPEFTDLKETADGCVVTYKIIRYLKDD
jgi:hypothetical protein